MDNSTLQIRHLAKEKLEVFENSIRPDGTYKDPIYRSAQSAGQQIASDYGSRFLVELVQNAYDAHPPERTDGMIQVLFEPEEDTDGVLYVANRGHGFTWSDVESLCNIGTSNKPVGESIGNKGLGFRSVRYITGDPQVYSKFRNGSTDSFDGYCLRFAHGDDFDNLLEDPIHRRLARKDIPQFHIPIPLTDLPAAVLPFAQQGFSTVIRLPLRDGFAHQAVIKEIESIRNSLVPLLLFLQRLNILEVIVQGEPERSCCLTRFSQPLQNGSNAKCNDKFTCVDLGHGEKYFVAWRPIPEEQVKRAIDKSIQQHQLHPSWTDWKGDGELAVAARLDDGAVSPRLYTFLPMGEHAECPFYGYLHGAFYPKADRTSLDATIPVNSLYIDEAARLCARTILALRQEDTARTALSDEKRGKVIVDLLVWRQTLSIARTEVSSAPILMREAFAELGQAFTEADILPIVPRRRGCWGKANEVWRWDRPDLKTFGASSLAKMADVSILYPGLGKDRSDRLQEFVCKGNDRLTLIPTEMQLSETAETVAAQVFRPRTSIRAMKDYYLELEDVFRARPVSLSSRRILFCQDGLLRAAMSKDFGSYSTSADANSHVTSKKTRRRVQLATAVFSPSKRFGGGVGDREETSQILHVPKELTKSFAFLTDKLDWYGDLDKVRAFLENGKLVRRYDADDLVAQVSILARNRRSKRTLQAALGWVFRLWRSSRKTQRPFSPRSARLFVPTLGGKWIEAEQAIFSGGWPVKTLGNVTEEFLAQTGAFADELRRLNDRLLCRRDSKLFLSRNLEEWADFLEAVGVKKGLQPLPVDNVSFKAWGWELEDKTICSHLKLGGNTIQYWQRDIKENGERPPYRGSQYELDGRFWYFPGQELHSAFSNGAKLLFAQLMLSWLEAEEQDKMKVAIFAPTARYASRFQWPTPLAAFMHQAAWFPVEIPDGLIPNLQFLKPSEVWLPSEDDDRLPPYLPRMHQGLRRALSSESTQRRLVDWCQANVVNAPNSLFKQVGYLAKILAERGIDPYFLQSFMNLYNETWARLASNNVIADNITPSGIQYLIIRQNGQLALVTVAPSNEFNHDAAQNLNEAEDRREIFVRDSEDNLCVDVIEKMGFRVFDSGTKNVAAVAALIKGLLGARFRAVSDFRFTVLVDGEEYDTSKSADDFAVNQCPWLPTVVYLAMESLTGTAAQHLPADRTEIISRLYNIRLRIARHVQFKVRNSVVELPDNNYGAVAFRHERSPLLIVQSEDGSLHWSALAHASSQLSQLVGQSDVGQPMLAAFRTLERLQEPVAGPIPVLASWVGELCNELHIDRRHAEKALEGLGRDVRRLARLLRPLVHYYGGMSTVEPFTRVAEKTKTLSDLASLLERYLVGTGHNAEAVINTCQRASGFGFIRDELALLFGKFNQSLSAVGEDPDIHRDAHTDAVHTFITCNKNAIMGCLRIHFLDQFRNRQTLQEYVHCREELDTLGPKEAWLVDYPVPETHMVKALVDEWLSLHGAPVMNGEQALLPNWSEVRNENKLRIKKMVQDHGNKIKAWCYQHGIEPPEQWKDNAAADNLCNALHQLGALDFELLEKDDLISWFVWANAWPKEMPPTLTLDKLGLKETDLDEQVNRERAAKLQREKEARSIVFNSRQIDPQEIDNGALASEILANLPIEVTSMKPDCMADLKAIAESEQKHGTIGGHGRGGGNRRMHPDRAELIGFIGECVVYYWLKKQLSQQDIDSSWASSYRSRLLPGAGDDSLGHDFKVRYRRHVLYLEVKSSLADPQQFELGDTEVRLARDCAAAKGMEYGVVYVSNVQDTRHTRLEILPNPLSDEGKHFFRIGSHGLRYEFLRGA